MRDDFAVIIISHGRPENSTHTVLRDSGYTGKIITILDDEDETIGQYTLNGDCAYWIFHKEDTFDLMDNFDGPRGIATYARNQCDAVAKVNGLKYFLLMDDDLKSISYRYQDGERLRGKKVTDLDSLLEAYLELMDNADISCLGFGNDSHYIGGLQSFRTNQFMRRFYNAYLLKAGAYPRFRGRYTEDTLMLLDATVAGNLMIAFLDVEMVFDIWTPKRNNDKDYGGCQDAYRENSGFGIRFYAVMAHPSGTVMKSKGADYIVMTKKSAFPMVISGRWRK